MSKKQIVMSEEKLRNFISYSVAKLLKEAYGRPIYDANGEYDGSEESDYGEDSLVFEPDIDEYLSDEVDFPSPIKVEVNYTRTEGMKGDGYMQPDDPDDYEIDSWRIINNDIPMEVRQEVMRAVKMYMENDFDIEEAVSEYGNIYEENRGVMAHFNGEGFKPKNPYEDMTWDEYCAAKKKERENDSEKKKLRDLNHGDDKENRGATVHFGGDKEKIHIGKDEISEMIQKAIRGLKRR